MISQLSKLSYLKCTNIRFESLRKILFRSFFALYFIIILDDEFLPCIFDQLSNLCYLKIKRCHLNCELDQFPFTNLIHLRELVLDDIGIRGF